MKHLFTSAILFAPDAEQGAGENNAPEVNNSIVVQDEMELPVTIRNGGKTGSRYFTPEVAKVIEGLKPKQGFIMPFMQMAGVKDPAKRQRYATAWRIKEWVKQNHVDGAADPAYTVAVIADKGIAVRRDS